MSFLFPLISVSLLLSPVNLSFAATPDEYPIECALPTACQNPVTDIDQALCDAITGQYPVTINYDKGGEIYGPICNFDEVIIVVISLNIQTLVYKDEILKIDYLAGGVVYTYTGVKQESVNFDHKAHTDKLGSCEKCHFGLIERIAFNEKEAHKEVCVLCHETIGGPIDCNGCHVPHDGGQKCKDCHSKK